MPFTNSFQYEMSTTNRQQRLMVVCKKMVTEKTVNIRLKLITHPFQYDMYTINRHQRLMVGCNKWSHKNCKYYM